MSGAQHWEGGERHMSSGAESEANSGRWETVGLEAAWRRVDYGLSAKKLLRAEATGRWGRKTISISDEAMK